MFRILATLMFVIIFYPLSAISLSPQEVLQRHVEMVNPTVRVEAEGESSGSGTAVSITMPNGASIPMILTNEHVVASVLKQAKTKKVQPAVKILGWIKENGKTYPVHYKGLVVESSKKVDLALILLQEKWVGPVASVLPANDSVVEGEDAWVAGSPLGSKPYLTQGLLSVSMQMESSGPKHVVSAPIIMGNSGGGVWVQRDNGFKLVGVPQMGPEVGGGLATSHGVAIPIETVRMFLASKKLGLP
jgi:S1-C subfamily serine protease